MNWSLVLTCIGEICDGIRGNLDNNRTVMCNPCFVLRGGVARKMAPDLPKTRARQPTTAKAAQDLPQTALDKPKTDSNPTQDWPKTTR